MFNSIKFKLPFLVIISITIATSIIIVIADSQFKEIIDKSQKTVYEEKLDAIWHILDRTDTRLRNTGLVEAYEEGFKASVVEDLRKSYYTAHEQSIFPFIIDTDLKTIMHPTDRTGSTSKTKFKGIKQILNSKTGDFISSYNGTTKWYIYKHFSQWNWIIGYSIPIDIKYSEVHSFRNTLIIIMFLVIAAALSILTFLIVRTINPIITLTRISAEIAAGNLDKKIEINLKDEVGILADSFENMRTVIKDKISDLNHEIIEREKAENYIINIIDSMPSILIGVDHQGVITQWNKKAEIVFSISTAEAHGKYLADVIPRLSKEIENIYKAINTGTQITDNSIISDSNGKLTYEDITIFPLTFYGTKGAVIRIDDVTERVRLEEMMIQNEKVLSLGGLAAGMAHEINNPLAGMIQSALVIKNRISDDSNLPANIEAAENAGIKMASLTHYLNLRNIPKLLDAILDSGKRASDIVSNMLSFSRKSTDTRALNDITALMDKTILLAGTDYNLKKNYDFKAISIKKEYENHLPQVICEPEKLQQVFLNILANGAQAMQESGTVKPCLTITILHKKEEKIISIEISDNGPGMKKEISRRIFEPFFTTKEVGTGTGLGLSISYHIIVKEHNGQMHVESTPEKGTTFFISLPTDSQS